MCSTIQTESIDMEEGKLSFFLKKNVGYYYFLFFFEIAELNCSSSFS